jgi:hypothetical protein
MACGTEHTGRGCSDGSLLAEWGHAAGLLARLAATATTAEPASIAALAAKVLS